MTVQFNIEYKAMFGEQIVVNIQTEEGELKLPLETTDGERWACDWCVESPEKSYTYYYSVEREGRAVKTEWLMIKHQLDVNAKKAAVYTLYDHWKAMPEDAYLYSSAFTDCINHQVPQEMKPETGSKIVRLIVRAPQLRDGERLGVLGADKALGAWDVQKILPMTQHTYNEWVADIDATHLEGSHLEFKFVAFRNAKNELLWENSMNRTVDLPEMKAGELVSYELDQASFALYNRKLAGTQVPVFSLRTRKSAGIGDFGDLKTMIDFVASTGQKVLQLLPINDTTITHTWTDSYPYSCISVFAIHPQYADLHALPELKDAKARAEAEKTRTELNALDKIDYEKVNDFKINYLRQIFNQEGGKMMKTAEYKAFFQDTELWLVPYAQYSYLRDKNGTADFNQWPDHQVWDEAERKALADPKTAAYKNVAFFYFVQFVLDRQMQEAHEHAKTKGVILKGDIPIGVNRNGCDVWTEPKYFNLNGQAGAPPDDFSANGQNWGFPTYNWFEMLKDGCQWWNRRFKNMARYFDAYRIDHVLGFFRIWEIPVHSVHGLLGQFAPALAMSREEIESYGLHFQEDRFTRPFITDWVLDRVFHERAGEVKEKYLDRLDDERYQMKPEVDTQRKVEALFADATDEKELWLRDGLYALISDVLFVRDHTNPGVFHPRISAQLDFIYESLYDNDKAAFNRLYNDYFYRRNNQFWYQEAMKKLPKLVQATRMLVCAEDLGMVPDCVPWVMDELKILSLELQSMPKDPSVKFGHLSRNPYRSVCTISSHDMPTLRMWWDENVQRTQEYYNTMLYRQGPAPHPLPGWLASDIISRHLTSPSMLCILSIQDWLATDEALRLPDADAERINIPANPKHYWRYRMHLNIEDLAADKRFVQSITEMISQSGRV
ncbi:4-alpha-glucanotransferase [Prevotella copri]|uniref:4-alpha-glucanotransferase n=1 Tax=Segatella copri TaxID=165179 RepID=A0AAW4NE65_9BACT|nr:4-alpha-glucanotransferase [Segatella copri]MBU9911930.1 4-alpha-glucanotransferase [Segatella copri]MBV3399719.1 4-alpha-glucanotransferase [Segatella copri]MBV3409273.1 4-alpha-glucanotransferase [Segatella copri]MBV3412390.1 4-alpha-glucanotransferase [Segatella copri]MBV3420799.1 4-alpha-glucanotransferase [Segatella copri]